MASRAGLVVEPHPTTFPISLHGISIWYSISTSIVWCFSFDEMLELVPFSGVVSGTPPRAARAPSLLISGIALWLVLILLLLCKQSSHGRINEVADGDHYD